MVIPLILLEVYDHMFEWNVFLSVEERKEYIWNQCGVSTHEFDIKV